MGVIGLITSHRQQLSSLSQLVLEYWAYSPANAPIVGRNSTDSALYRGQYKIMSVYSNGHKIVIKYNVYRNCLVPNLT